MTVAIRTLRRSRQLTITDIALLTGIPARTVAEFEHGLRQLDRDSAALFSSVFGLPPDALIRRLTAARVRPPSARRQLQLLAAGSVTVAALAGAGLRPATMDDRQWTMEAGAGLRSATTDDRPRTTPMTLESGTVLDVNTQLQPFFSADQRPVTSDLPSVVGAPRPVVGGPSSVVPSAPLRASRGPSSAVGDLPSAVRGPSSVVRGRSSVVGAERPAEPALAQPAAMAERRLAQMTAVPAPTAVPVPAFAMRDDGPHGCPVAGPGVVITQPYGVGTHAPAKIWGAVDLAVDGDGDGVPEPGTTFGVPVLATHNGIARVYPGTWPGGNVVMVHNRDAGWVTLYAHLADFLVQDGDQISAGTPIGTIGSTGQSSGPHLHYEVRSHNGNIDPAPLIGCDR